jgi:hypothetical protein
MDAYALINGPVVNRVGPLGDPPLAAPERVCACRPAASA